MNPVNTFPVVWEDVVQLVLHFKFEEYSYESSVFRKICEKMKTIFIFCGLMYFLEMYLVRMDLYILLGFGIKDLY